MESHGLSRQESNINDYLIDGDDEDFDPNADDEISSLGYIKEQDS
jgi:hypothetical protein